MSTSEPYPHQNALRGTLLFEVNFTGWGNPCQKYLRGRLSNLVKFTFRAAPLQKAFWGWLPFEVERFCWDLGALPRLQCPQRHIAFRGEFHRLGLPLPEVPERPIGMTREIHLSGRPPPECLLGQVALRGGTTLCPPRSVTPSTMPSEAHWFPR